MSRKRSKLFSRSQQPDEPETETTAETPAALPDLDARVAREVMDEEPGTQYSESLESALPVLTRIKKELFSVRQNFEQALTASISDSVGCNIAWPDALFFMTGEHICRAALTAMGAVDKRR